MAEEVTLENIEALNIKELSEALTNNGFGECAEFVLKYDINGESFLTINEFYWYKGGVLKPKEVKKIREFIAAIRIDPKKFVLPRTVYKEKKQNKAEDDIKIEFIQKQINNSNENNEQIEDGEGGACAQLAVDTETENLKFGEWFEAKPSVKLVSPRLQRFMSQPNTQEQDGYDFLIKPAMVTPEDVSRNNNCTDNSLTGNKYYLPVNRDKGQQMLESTPEGTFLLRSSTSHKYHCALMVNTEQCVRNVPIVCKDGKYYLEDGRGSTKNQDEVFYDLYSLIAYYTEHEIELSEKNVLLVKNNILLRK